MARAGVVATSLNRALPLPGAAMASSSNTAVADATGNLVAVVPFNMGTMTRELHEHVPRQSRQLRNGTATGNDRADL